MITYICLLKFCGVPNVFGNEGRNIGAGDEAGLEKKGTQNNDDL